MLKVEDLAVPTILAFLESLERERNNSVATRNVRLAGVKAFFRYLEYRAPAYLDMALQVRTLSRKRTDTRSSTGSTTRRCRPSLMRRTPQHRQESGTGRCSIFASLPACGSRS